MRYYIDTAIWMDILEDRRGYHGEPLGETGASLLLKISDQEIVVSDVVLSELQRRYRESQIAGMVAPFSVLFVTKTSAQHAEARSLAQDRKVPVNDALHAVLARDHQCVLVTRDRHFLALRDICPSRKPEELL